MKYSTLLETTSDQHRHALAQFFRFGEGRHFLDLAADRSENVPTGERRLVAGDPDTVKQFAFDAALHRQQTESADGRVVAIFAAHKLGEAADGGVSRFGQQR